MLLDHTLQHMISLQFGLVPMNAHCRPPATDTHRSLVFVIILHYSTVLIVLLMGKLFKCYQQTIWREKCSNTVVSHSKIPLSSDKKSPFPHISTILNNKRRKIPDLQYNVTMTNYHTTNYKPIMTNVSSDFNHPPLCLYKYNSLVLFLWTILLE